MTTIDLTRGGSDFYYTCEERSVKVAKANHTTGEPAVVRGKANITMHTKKPVEPGTILYCLGQAYVVEKVLERRDCKGRFTDPEEAKDSFVDVDCTFERRATS